MATKYILSRDQFLLTESVQSNPLFTFFQEVGEELSEMLDTIAPVMPESVSDEFIENSQKYSIELDSIGFNDNSKLEHILYAMGTTGVTLFTESNFQIQSVVDQYYAVNEAVIDTLRSIWNALTEDGSPMGILHLLLDIIGFLPGAWVGFPIDVVADGLNALIYLFEGQYGSALISAIAAAIPGIGDFAKALKLTKGFRNINKLAEVAFKTGKADKGLVRILAKEDPGTLSKFLDLVKGAKPVVGFFASLAKGIGRGIEALLRTWPISMLFGKIGKALGKWLDDAVEPITKNLDTAIIDMGTLTTKASDEVTDIAKAADAGLGEFRKIIDDLAVAKKAGNTAEVKRLEGLLQTRIPKGTPGAGQFVKGGRLIDVVNSNLKITDELLKKGGKPLEEFLEKGWDEYITVWKDLQKIKGVPLGADDLKKIEELKGLWIEGRKAEAVFAGMKSLDKIPVDDLVKLTGDAASITTKKGANFSARLVAEIADDPIKLGKFFDGILKNPAALARLEAAGPGVADMYRIFAKNPKVYIDVSKAGSAAIKHFEKISAAAGKWTQAVRGSRLMRNRLIIAKNVIGAPLRCPIASLGQGNIGGIEALTRFGVKESTKFILSRRQFLLEAEDFSVIDTTSKPAPTPTIELTQEIDKLKSTRGNAVFGPVSYVDICQSHISETIDKLAVTATFPPKDSTLVKNGPDKSFVAAGAHSEATISNQEAVDATLSQVGIEPTISDAGLLPELPSNATVEEVISERIGTDSMYGGLWYMLAAVMTGDENYSAVKSKIKLALAEYEANYARTVGNANTTGRVSFYPSPEEAAAIKVQLSRLDADPGYSPRFFGPSITSLDLIKMF
jgi:hypothetical protein